MNPVRRTRTVADAVRARVALIGADPHDDEDTRSSKALLVLISVLILPIALLWGVLYLAFGSPVGFVPLVYFVVLLGAIGVFTPARLRPAAPREPVGHPVRADAVDDPARWLPRLRGRGPVGRCSRRSGPSCSATSARRRSGTPLTMMRPEAAGRGSQTRHETPRRTPQADEDDIVKARTKSLAGQRACPAGHGTPTRRIWRRVPSR